MAKILNKGVATSIICSETLLNNNIDLDFVADNRENKYYSNSTY